MSIEIQLLKLVEKHLRVEALSHPEGSEEQDALLDASDALSDVIELLEEDS